MHNENDNSAPPPAARHSGTESDDGIPILRDAIEPSASLDVPTLDASYAVVLPAAPPQNGISSELIAEIADNLQLTLNRELDYAIDGAVYERLQRAMEEVATSVKKQIHHQLEQKLPELIVQTLGKDN